MSLEPLARGIVRRAQVHGRRAAQAADVHLVAARPGEVGGDRRAVRVPQVAKTAYAQAGQPVEFARDLFRGDRTRLVIWTSELAGDA